MNREPGFYRVKYEGKWIIAEWKSDINEWYVCGNDCQFYDSDFSEINEIKIIFDIKEATDEEVLNLYSGFIRYGYQEAIDEIENWCETGFDEKVHAVSLELKLSEMTATKKEINFQKLQSELNTQ